MLLPIDYGITTECRGMTSMLIICFEMGLPVNKGAILATCGSEVRSCAVVSMKFYQTNSIKPKDVNVP